MQTHPDIVGANGIPLEEGPVRPSESGDTARDVGARMNTTEEFEQYRPLLFGIAYRMLSGVMEAEDMVQEVYLRWQGVDRATVASPRAYLTTTMTRLCIDQLRAARRQRETYIGPWLPEPLVTESMDDPQEAAMRGEAISMAFLTLMEELNPEQRAAFLLHDVFDYDYAAIAQILQKREDNCRQLVSRARRILRGHPLQDPTPLPEQMATAQRFWTALQQGEVQDVLNVLAGDVVWWSDGGGKATAARKPIHGADAVARFALGLAKRAPAGVAQRWTVINDRPGVIVYVDGAPFLAISIEVHEGRIESFWAVLNPDKLAALPAWESR